MREEYLIFGYRKYLPMPYYYGRDSHNEYGVMLTVNIYDATQFMNRKHAEMIVEEILDDVDGQFELVYVQIKTVYVKD